MSATQYGGVYDYVCGVDPTGKPCVTCSSDSSIQVELGGYCEHNGESQALGLACCSACLLFVLAMVFHDLTDFLKLPLFTEETFFIMMGALLAMVPLTFEYTTTNESVFEYRPAIFKFVMLPVIVFSGSYRCDAKSLIIYAGQTVRQPAHNHSAALLTGGFYAGGVRGGRHDSIDCFHRGRARLPAGSETHLSPPPSPTHTHTGPPPRTTQILLPPHAPTALSEP